MKYFKHFLKGTSHNVSGVSEVVRKAFDELAKTDKLIPFDQIYDEDELTATNEQYDMILAEITGFEKMFETTEDISEKEDIKKQLDDLKIAKATVDDKLENLLLQRCIEYAKWKNDYLYRCETSMALRSKISKLLEVEKVLEAFLSNNTKMTTLLNAQLHHIINLLLSCENYAKENTPFGAFNSAYNKNLISSTLFAKLTKK
jgi:hypothetical protein